MNSRGNRHGERVGAGKNPLCDARFRGEVAEKVLERRLIVGRIGRLDSRQRDARVGQGIERGRHAARLRRGDVNGDFAAAVFGGQGGINGTPLLYQAADMAVDPKTNRLYVSDGYGNRRILIVDAETGKYLGHFGAY